METAIRVTVLVAFGVWWWGLEQHRQNGRIPHDLKRRYLRSQYRTMALITVGALPGLLLWKNGRVHSYLNTLEGAAREWSSIFVLVGPMLFLVAMLVAAGISALAAGDVKREVERVASDR